MIQYATETPFAHLDEFTEHTDLDFALAHLVLDSDSYREHYARRAGERGLILDSVNHELGEPTRIRDLLKASELVHADYAIAPNEPCEAGKNLEWLRGTSAAFVDSPTKVGVVMSGHDAMARRDFLVAIWQQAAMLCLPSTVNRLLWYVEQQNLLCAMRMHLLGMFTLDELRVFAELRAHLPPHATWSMNTSIPIRNAAASGGYAAHVKHEDFLSWQMSPSELRKAKENMQNMRLVLFGNDDL